MENFIIRIYRRDENNPDDVVGTLESVEIQQQWPFHNFSTLFQMLSDPASCRKEKATKTDCISPSFEIDENTKLTIDNIINIGEAK